MRFAFILFTLLSLAFSAFSQPQDTPSERPKIGLVLSGGGAKGIAHIGVLRAMEKAGIRPDYITGTSMGSLVGGLYAIGYSADDIEQIIRGINWNEVLSNKIPYRNVVVEEKPYYYRFMIDLVFDGQKISLPQGMIQSQQINLLLSTLTRSVHGVEQFDDFPIPFRCIASDIATGDKVVLSHGNLALAMRASMAIPSVFTPINLDDKILVDGGLIRNFPVDEVKEMGADIVIGVLVAQDLLNKEALKSATGILFQSAWMNGAYDTRIQKAKCNALIQPDLLAFTSGSFNKFEEILAQGNKTGEEFQPYFDHLADSLASFGEQAPIKKRHQRDEYNITQFELAPSIADNESLLASTLRFKKNDVIDVDEINNELRRIYGTLQFSRLNYEILKTTDSTNTIKLTGEKSPMGRLSFSPNYSSEYRAGLVFNFAVYDWVFPNSRLNTELNLSEYPYMNINFLKGIKNSNRVSVYLDMTAASNPMPRYSSFGKKTALMTEQFFKPMVGIRTVGTFKHSVFFEAGATFAKHSPTIADETIRLIDNLNYTNLEYRFRYTYNSLDRRFYARKGADVVFSTTVGEGLETLNFNEDVLSDLIDEDITLEKITSKREIITARFNFDQHFPIGEHWSVQLGADAFYSFNTNQNLLNSAFVGGFNPREGNSIKFWGLGLREIPAEDIFVSRLGVQYMFRNKYVVRGLINYGYMHITDSFFSPDISPYIYDPFENDIFQTIGGGLEVAYLSKFGPISAQTARAWGNRHLIFNLNIGFWL